MAKVFFMEKKLKNGIPIWEWNGIPLIRVGKVTFVTAKPIGINVRSLIKAKEIANNFSEKHDCQATVTYDSEWLELCTFLKVNFAAKEFITENNLDSSEVLLLDTITEGDKHVLAAGYYHGLNEIFHGFVSGEDSDGEPQPQKSVFLTLRFHPDVID